ncbi:MAG: hypothetical protein A3I68_00945 [Candidatus Melainabacteria bacterium RIFCSPLOWO2_02_FULL_35_15]|nr:MAG: hypothetical protein A3F80_09300 [Candidatus Melainabacteria bacterium RIFCSPLOWO2_12_FULL_35_11]OGI13346.1 MAG: hypothetical protein A3I68_00945 [Candidatus Melainabacteria bacterium RIFCSPLOWO2_02_FULL_35_15]
MKKPFTIYFASSNKNKLKEIKSILSHEKMPANINIRLAPEGFTVNENSCTFVGNAAKKACVLSKKLRVYAFSDDSGIEVFALDRKPGIKSSRFFRNGKGMLEIVKKVKNKKNKKCCFTCALVVSDPEGKIIFKTQKSWYGEIAKMPAGKYGFGYDPIFTVPKLNKTSAQLSPRLKNKLSHRSMAVKVFAKWLRKKIKICESCFHHHALPDK